MKILVLSDSHGGWALMNRSVEALKPDVLIHLGDYWDDAQALTAAWPSLPMYCVPGNCDAYRGGVGKPKILTPTIGGVPFYLTHGHLHHVKTGRRDLLLAAREAGVQAVLYGHTHIPMCGREPDGLWVLNPGTCAGPGGTVGLIRLENGRVEDMRILRDSDLEV